MGIEQPIVQAPIGSAATPQSVGLIHDVASAAEIVERLAAECDAAARRLATVTQDPDTRE